MKYSAHGAGVHGEGDPPLISAANASYGVATAAAIDDLAMTSLPLPVSPTCRHYDSPYDVHRAVTWSRHQVIDDFGPDLPDGLYGIKLANGTGQAICPRRHRQVATPCESIYNSRRSVCVFVCQTPLATSLLHGREP